jgi:hypothetical protein
MKRTDTFKIKTIHGAGHISAASRLVRSLMGVEWGDIDSTATELTVTYDDYWITRSSITSALKGIGVTCKVFSVLTKHSSIIDHLESRTTQKIMFCNQEYRHDVLRSPKPVCGCC